MTIGSINAQDIPHQLLEEYANFKEMELDHRRFKHRDLELLVEKLPAMGFEVSEAGRSYQGRAIYLISMGRGSKTALLWSQMHGNEATATMAMFDIFNYLGKSDSELVKRLLDELTIYFIPMLNPDGAELFQRRTSQGIDMNRDALKLRCPESRILKSLRDSIEVDWGFNLHDQNIYYTVGNTAKPATISFLAPAYNKEKEVNKQREAAMKVIAAMNEALQLNIPGQVGIYDDTFEPRAFGDNIQKWGTSTILIESGGFPGDPEKQYIRQLNYLAILTGLYSIATGEYKEKSLQEYWDIPFNNSNLNDVLIRNVQIRGEEGQYGIDIAIRREEFDRNGLPPLYYKGTVEDMGDLSTQYGYQEISGERLSYAPGRIYPEIMKDQQAVIDLGITELLQQGYTYFRIEQEQEHTGQQQQQQEHTGQGGYRLLFDVINHEFELPQLPKVEQPATFLLLKNGRVKYAVINGFVHEVDSIAKDEMKPFLLDE